MAADNAPIFTSKLDDSLALEGEEDEEEARRPYKRQSGALGTKLQRPISKDERSNRKWWKRAFGLFTKKNAGGLCIRRRVSWGALLYETESSGPLRGLKFLEEGVPYFNLSDLNFLEDRGFSSQKTMTRPPIYLVT